MLNNVNLCGRLVKDPELRATTNGTSVATFTIAVDRDYTGTGEKQTDFINIVAWKGTAEFVGKYFTKGKLIIINGNIQVRKYEQNGENRYVTEVIARNVYFAGDKTEKPSNEPVTPPTVDYSAIDDDLPF